MWVRALQSVRRNWAIAVVMNSNLQELRPQAEPAGGKPAGSESDGSGHRRAAAKEAIDVPRSLSRWANRLQPWRHIGTYLVEWKVVAASRRVLPSAPKQP